MTNLDILKQRHSVRTFINKEIPDNILAKLRAEITMINTHEAGMKFQLFVNDESPFNGFTKSYGFFRNPRNYIAAVVDTTYSHIYQRAGFFAQQIVIKAVECGLGTCYVGGTYDKNSTSARIRVGEKLLFLILLGYEDKTKNNFMARIGYRLSHLKRMSPSDFLLNVTETDLIKFPLLIEAAEAVSYSPSSLNKRPTRIECNNGEIYLKVNSNKDSDLIDLGIAQYNFQHVLPGEWEWGNPSKFLPY